MKVTYRKSYDVVGFAYWADVYCLECGSDLPDIDPEGNEKYPVFLDSVDEFRGYACCDCGESVTDW